MKINLKHLFLMLFLTAFCLGTWLPAGAQEVLGLPVYPGAKPQPETTTFLQKNMGMNGAAYHSPDSLAKVVAFYKNQDGLKTMLADAESAMFRSPQGVDVTIQNPWMNMSTGKMVHDTLISIVKPQ